MPRKYIRKSNRASWSEEDLRNAFEKIRNENMQIREAARRYHIPERTLRRRLLSNNSKKGNLGPSSYLQEDVETKIVKHIRQLQKLGFSPTKKIVKQTAFAMERRLSKKRKFNQKTEQAGDDWYKSFMERNPSLSLKKTEGAPQTKDETINRDDVNNYFALLQKLLKANDLLRKPGRIFNVDETELQLNNKPGKVLVMKETVREKVDTVTVVACCNAEGAFLPPFCIFKGTEKKPEFEAGMPPGSVVAMNKKSANITNDIFFDWLKNHFSSRKPSGKVLLLLDGHSSHMSIDCLEFAAENDIILVCLPNHTSPYLQPLDCTFFEPLKSNYYQACDEWITSHQNKIPSYLQFGGLINSAWCKVTLGIAIDGFRVTGVHPLNPLVIPEVAFAASDRKNQQMEDNADKDTDGNSSDAEENRREIKFVDVNDPSTSSDFGDISQCKIPKQETIYDFLKVEVTF